MQAARDAIARGFADALPKIVKGYVYLATDAADEDVRRKASDRILDTFLPTAGKVQQVGGTTIQILNAMPVPEIRAVGGKESPLVEIGEAKFALTSPKKRTILPEQAAGKRRAQLLPEGALPPQPSEVPLNK